MPNDLPYKIRENSWLARLAAWKLKARQVAIVFGDTIHLCNTSREEFLANKKWVKHEQCHIRQYHELGFIPFILQYLRESIRNGYYNNKFEVEARKAELEDQ